MADRIGPHHDAFLTQEALTTAYRRLLALFARHEVPATFAFVMAFTLDEAERRRARDLFRDVAVEGQNWLGHYRRAEQLNNFAGWHCPEALDLVRAQPQHEIACHGFSHLPLAEDTTSAADAQRELAAAGEVARWKGLNLETFVYPRNQVGHSRLLPAQGYRGYRAPPVSRLGQGRLA